MNPRICRCVCTEGRRVRTALTGTRTPMQQSSSFTPGSLLQVCHCKEAQNRAVWQPLASRLSGKTPGSCSSPEQKSNSGKRQCVQSALAPGRVCQGDLHGPVLSSQRWHLQSQTLFLSLSIGNNPDSFAQLVLILFSLFLREMNCEELFLCLNLRRYCSRTCCDVSLSDSFIG